MAAMNAPFIPKMAEPLSPTDQGVALIGKLIIACAGFERNLTLLLRLLDRAASPRLLPSQKIKAIRDALAGQGAGGLAPRQCRRISIILQEAEALLALRAECAHSTVSVAEIDGERHLVLRNAQQAGDPLDRCVLLTERQIIVAKGRVMQLTHQLGQILHPPLPNKAASSPVTATAPEQPPVNDVQHEAVDEMGDLSPPLPPQPEPVATVGP